MIVPFALRVDTACAVAAATGNYLQLKGVCSNLNEAVENGNAAALPLSLSLPAGAYCSGHLHDRLKKKKKKTRGFPQFHPS